MKSPDEKVITSLNRKLSISIAKTAQLVEELIEVKESNENMHTILENIYVELIVDMELKFSESDKACIMKALRKSDKAKQS